MKDGVVLVNAARGGIFNMDALADFVAAGKIAAVAVDSFEAEPCTDSPLHEFENAILTPHLSPMTHEAQRRASTQIAEYVEAGLEGGMVATAVNLSPLPPEVFDAIGPYVHACKMMGSMASQILGHTPKSLKVELAGGWRMPTRRRCSRRCSTAACPTGASGPSRRPTPSRWPPSMAFPLPPPRRAMPAEYASSVRIVADEVEVAATLFGTEHTPRIISLMGYKIDIAPATTSLVFEYVDAPGRIGVIGTILGDAAANITTMQIGTRPEESCALVYMNVEGDVSEAVLDRLRGAIDLRNLWKITL
ncbi:MAG: NAD(P)-dependent oxidoreductase [Adlercreutzia equolifaciens]